MSPASKSKLLLIIIGILMLTNIALVAFFVFGKQKRSHKNDRPSPGSMVTEMLKEKVGFDDAQMATYLQIKTQHKASMDTVFQQLRSSKENFYKLLKDSTVSDSVLNHASAQIGDRQQLFDQQIFNHFRNIRNICTPDQRPRFDSLVDGLIRKLIPGRRPPKDSADHGKKHK